MPVTEYISSHASYDYREPIRPAVRGETIEACAVNHRTSCPRGKSGWPDTDRTKLTNDCVRHGCTVGYIRTRYQGRVLAEREANGYHDSDFYATVLFDDGTFDEVCYASTRGWTYFNSAAVDASALTLHLYREWGDRGSIVGEIQREERQAKLAEIRESMPAFGQTWRVKSKRSKLPHGAAVEIAADPELSGYAPSLRRSPLCPRETLEERYAERPSDVRLRVRLPDGSTRWCAASVVEPAIAA